MKISIWHLYERLMEYTPTANIVSGACEIQDVRVFSPNNHLYFTDYVYLVSLDPEYGWKMSQNSVILIHKQDMLILHDATFYDVMNKIMDIFDHFRKIKQNLERACKSAVPYEEMLDILYDYYHLPIVIANNNLKILAATDVIGAIVDGWDIIFQTHYMPVTFFSVFNNEDNNRRFITCKKPFLMDPVNPNAAKHYRKLFVIPFESNRMSAGKVLINVFDDTLSPGSLLMGEIFADYFSRISSENEDTYHMTAYFENALRHNYYSKEEVQVIYSMRRWEPGTAFTLCVLRDSRRQLTIPELRWCCGILELNIQGSIAFTFDDQVVLLIPHQHNSVEYLLALVFQNYIPGFSFQCGASLSFRSFRTLKRHYSQALYSLNQILGAESHHMRVQDCGYRGICAELALSFDWENYYPPELTKLEAEDRAQHTDYYKTFFFYLWNGQQLQTTAEQLHIHPNTLKYRLHKIFARLNYQPEDLEKRHYYLLCMQLSHSSPAS